jgi:hypothetical protein
MNKHAMTVDRPLLTLGWEIMSVSNASDTGPSGTSGTERIGNSQGLTLYFLLSAYKLHCILS